MASRIFVNIGSGNGLLPDGTKPLPEPKLTFVDIRQACFTRIAAIAKLPLFQRGNPGWYMGSRLDTKQDKTQQKEPTGRKTYSPTRASNWHGHK